MMTADERADLNELVTVLTDSGRVLAEELAGLLSELSEMAPGLALYMPKAASRIKALADGATQRLAEHSQRMKGAVPQLLRITGVAVN